MTPTDDLLDRLARSPVLLVAADYDGTLAPIVPDPAAAAPDREALAAMRMLAELPNTHAAVISGRALDELTRLSGAPRGVHLVGSHGGEFEAGFAASLSDDARALRTRLSDLCRRLAGEHPGFVVEDKPAGVAFHYRNAAPGAARAALERLAAAVAGEPGARVRHGKAVVELSVVDTSKGHALSLLRARLGATAVVFLGDDQTDEDAFAVLSGPDAAVKVGPEETRAPWRLDGQARVAPLLGDLAQRRQRWVFGASATPIERHAILSDQRSLAVVSPTGEIVWLCLPRLDSPALFAALLGGPPAGSFDVRPDPAGDAPAQQWDGDSFVLRTQWADLRVTDYFDCSAGRAHQRAGRSELLRVLEGRGRVNVRFAPRLNFGRTPTRISAVEGGLVVDGSLDPICLHAPGVRWRIADEGAHQTALGELVLSEAPAILELRFGTGHVGPGVVPEADRRRQTLRHWQAWAATLRLPTLEPELVKRSALVVRALTYGPTGAIAAAGTTSLPEQIGGARNWDYRYCWPRDACLAAAALVRLGNTGHAMKLLDWLLGVVDECESPDRLRPLYTVLGRELGPEGEISELPGYRGSRPVRVGNAAAEQVQLDVFGPIVDLVAELADRGAGISGEHLRLVDAMVGAVALRWREPDHGIWEIRTERRHHVHSKVMCWLTVDRALRVLGRVMGRAREDWAALRDAIAADVLAHGWKPGVGSFTGTYDRDEPDAAALWVGLSGMLPPGDPRFAGTVAFVERHLLDRGCVRRYVGDDGLPGGEGAFNLCTAWLIESLALLGRTDEADDLFRRYCRLAGPTGLMAEEVDPHTGEALGNFPQLYTHLGLINAAVRLSRPDR